MKILVQERTIGARKCSIGVLRCTIYPVVLSAALFFLVFSAQASWSDWSAWIPQMPWETPSAQVSDGCDSVKKGVCSLCSGVVGYLYKALASGAQITGLSKAWKSHREATAVILTAAVVAAYLITYKVGKKEGKQEMARAIARSIQDEPQCTEETCCYTEIRG